MDTLEQTIKGSLFKGVTNRQFCEEVVNYFLPRFNAPIRFEPAGNTLSDMAWKHYGEHNIGELLQQNAPGSWYVVVSNKGREIKTEITPEMLEYIREYLK